MGWEGWDGMGWAGWMTDSNSNAPSNVRDDNYSQFFSLTGHDWIDKAAGFLVSSKGERTTRVVEMDRFLGEPNSTSHLW